MKMIAQLPGVKLFKIDAVKKYSSDYTVCTKEAQKEFRAHARPELTKYPDSIDEYDTMILGYPNYWGTMPMPVFTFLEKFDFSNKTVLPLCTHEGSGMGHSENDIKELCPKADVRKGLAIYGSAVNHAGSDIKRWLENQGV